MMARSRGHAHGSLSVSQQPLGFHCAHSHWMTNLLASKEANAHTPRVPASQGRSAHTAAAILRSLFSISVKSLLCAYHIPSSGVHAALPSLLLAEPPRWEVSQVPTKEGCIAHGLQS